MAAKVRAVVRAEVRWQGGRWMVRARRKSADCRLFSVTSTCETDSRQTLLRHFDLRD